MIYGSVCSGIEAASVAWRPLGWEPAFVSEIDPFPRAVLAERFPETPLHGDFTTIGAGDYRAIDLLVGGTPCQDFSIAGLRAGMAGDRGNLTLEYLRLARRIRPGWLVWENVPGVLSSNGGRDFGAFLGGLVELGYGFAYRVLDAQHFGVPQRRRRVFVVGYFGDWRRAAAVLFERASLRRDHSPSREAREDVAGGAAYGISADCFDRSGEGAGGSAGERSGLGVEEGLAQTLRAKRPGAVAFGLIGNGEYVNRPASLRAEGGDCGGGSEHLVAYGGNRQSGPIDIATAVNAHGGPHGRLDFESETFITFDPTQITSRTNRSSCLPGAPSHTLASGARPPHIAFSIKDHGADASGIAPTLRAMGHAASHANAGGQIGVAFDLRNGTAEGTAMSLQAGGMGDDRGLCPNAIPHTIQASAVRRLTPRECERLQGFPDDYTLIRYRNKPAADGPRYKALGNSMAVPVMAWIGRRIGAVEQVLAHAAATAA